MSPIAGKAQNLKQFNSQQLLAQPAVPNLRKRKLHKLIVKSTLSAQDLRHLRHAATLADSSAGLTAPHPNAACVLVNSQGHVVGTGFQRAQGTTSAEVLAIQDARSNGVLSLNDCTAYLNLESGDCHGDQTTIQSLIQSGIQKVSIGLLHPLQHLRGYAVTELLKAGIQVSVLGQFSEDENPEAYHTRHMCLEVNDALLHRSALKRPMSILKYAMTLDGKIATTTGHSAWVSGKMARARVFEMRGRSNAVIVGGNTQRRDNPRLTTRRENGHAPVRIVMSRTMDLREDANLWDISIAPTIVMTQKGARSQFQAELRDRGVEVVEFDFLNPENVAQYLYNRGFLRCLWECGGTLASPAISGGTIHKVMAFVAPKIIGGVKSPSPVGDLGFVEMTQALDVVDSTWSKIDNDLLLEGYLPSSGGLEILEEIIEQQSEFRTPSSALEVRLPSSQNRDKQQQSKIDFDSQQRPKINFYKVWDRWGALSNFSPHPIQIPKSTVQHQFGQITWQSVEHYYQTMKFAGNPDPQSQEIAQQIMQAGSPEEAAILGRKMLRERPDLATPDFLNLRQKIMYEAIYAKFTQHDDPKQLLLKTENKELVENSPNDVYWGCGLNNEGQNNLGKLLMRLREEFQQIEKHDNGYLANGCDYDYLCSKVD